MKSKKNKRNHTCKRNSNSNPKGELEFESYIWGLDLEIGVGFCNIPSFKSPQIIM
jgi:hypothetical protein